MICLPEDKLHGMETQLIELVTQGLARMPQCLPTGICGAHQPEVVKHTAVSCSDKLFSGLRDLPRPTTTFCAQPLPLESTSCGYSGGSLNLYPNLCKSKLAEIPSTLLTAQLNVCNLFSGYWLIGLRAKQLQNEAFNISADFR